MYLFYFTKSEGALASLMISDDWTYENHKHASRLHLTWLRWNCKVPYIIYTIKISLLHLALLISVQNLEFLVPSH
jgi:hypothetical protein